ncbi:MAG: hypothetical protein EXS17_08155 [Phycisphaerales bacterium]|nr:hypothetical protein [Phycisphaerales bacterium]
MAWSRSLSGILIVLTTVLSVGVRLASGADEVSIVLEHFGVGDHFRTGDVVGARFALKGELDAPTPVELAWEVPDGNGDIANITRRLVLDPGQTSSVWMYARIPPQQNANAAMAAVYTIRVWEESEGKRVRELGSTRFSPATGLAPSVVVELQDDLFGVLGSGRLGLDVYESPPAGSAFIPTMNAMTRIARRIRPQDLPDRWEGLAAFSALIWTDESPQALTGDAATALREWIRRGGLFVVVLPESADGWGIATGAQHPLSALMPSRGEWIAKRVDAVAIRQLVPVLSQSKTLLSQTATMPVTFFERRAKISSFDPLLFLAVPRVRATGFANPHPDSYEGDVIGLTRAYGHGRITIIGLDVDALHRRALQEGGLPRADMFWNRVLGRRADALSSATLGELTRKKRLVVATPTFVDLGRGELVSNIIGMRGQAALGILAAFLLFAAYWVLAGPGGFGLLKWLHLQRHAWVVFVMTALVFGSGVWVIGTLMTSNQARLQHLTVLDSISWPAAEESKQEPALMRATCWFSAFLPGYGQTTVAIDDDDKRRNTLTSWSAPPGGSAGDFPNPAQTALPLESPGILHVAARATSASFEAQWLGVASRNWGSTPRVIDLERPLVQSVVPGDPLRVSLTGVLQHALPGTLYNVGFIHITPIRSPLPKSDAANNGTNDPSNALPNVGRFGIMSEWAAGQPIELSAVFSAAQPQGDDEHTGDLARAIRVRYEEPFTMSALEVGIDARLTWQRERTYLDMLTMFNMLQPPAYLLNPPEEVSPLRVQRMLARSVDLSQWFTTPCLIVFGYLERAQCPVPIRIDGKEVTSNGLVLVRVIFPLPVDERFAAPTSD